MSFAPVVQHARLPDWLRRMQGKKALRNEENRRRSIDVAIEWQILSVHALRSQSYMLQCTNKKAPTNMLSRSKAPKTQQIAVTDTRDFLMAPHSRQLRLSR